MAFTPDTFSVITQPIGGTGIRFISYRTPDTIAEVTTEDYFVGVSKFGVKEHDLIFVVPLTDGEETYILTLRIDADGNGTGTITESEGATRNFDSRAAVAAARIPGSTNAVYTLGYASAGDGGAARYKRVALEPSHAGKIQSLDGAWWELDEEVWRPKMFGTPANGIGRDDLLMQAMFSAAPDGKEIVIPAATYRFQGRVDILNKSLKVDARGATFFMAANTLAFLISSEPVVRTLTADYVPGALSISVSALPVALQMGDAFKIVSDAVDPANRDSGSSATQYRIGEWAHAGEGSTTTSIVLKTPLRFSRAVNPVSSGGEEARVNSYRTTYNAKVLVLSGHTVDWTGGSIRYEDGHEANWNNGGIQVKGMMQAKIHGMAFPKGYSIALSLAGNYRNEVTQCYFGNLRNNTGGGQYGYGIADASFATLVHGCVMLHPRHGYTTAAPATVAATSDTTLLLSQGRTIGAQVSDCVGFGSDAAVFDTHHDAEDVTFKNCKVFGGGMAFGMRGRNITFDGCQALGVVDAFYCFTEYEGGDPDDDLLVAGKPEGATTGRVINPVIRCSGLPFYAASVRSLDIVNADVVSAQHRLIDAEGSNVTWVGHTRFKVSTMDGAMPITENAAAGAIGVRTLTSAWGGLQDWPSRQTVAEGCSMLLDMTAATDATNSIFAVKCQAAADGFYNYGQVKAILSSAFSDLVSGPEASYWASENSNIEVEVVGAADNSKIAGVKGKRLKVTTTDLSAWWNDTGDPRSNERLSWSAKPDVAVVGTGSMITTVYEALYAPTAFIDSNGHYVRHEFNIKKTGTTGVATVRIRSTGGSQVDVPMASTDVNCRIVVEVFTRGDNSQDFMYWWSTSNAAGLATPAGQGNRLESRTDNLSNAPGRILFFDAQAVVGDTLTFRNTRIYGDVSGFGI